MSYSLTSAATNSNSAMLKILSQICVASIESVSNMLNVDPNKVLKGVIIAYRYSILVIDILAFFFNHKIEFPLLRLNHTSLIDQIRLFVSKTSSKTLTYCFKRETIPRTRAFFEYFRLLYRFFIPKTMRNLDGEIVLITGAGSGIGKQLAIQLSNQGCILVCLDIDHINNEKTVQFILSQGGKAHAYRCDVSSWEKVDSVVKKIQKEVGNIDVLINNAGVLVCRPFIQHQPQQIEKMVQTNLLGQLWLIRSILPQMLSHNKGSIIALCSVTGHAGAPNMVPYTASKFGVRGMMEALYIELRQENPNHKIHLMTVSPFMVDTLMVKSPRIRFPGLLDIVTAEKAASIIITNLRMRTAIVFIPNSFYYLQCFVRILPSRVQLLLTDFIDTGIGIDYTN